MENNFMEKFLNMFKYKTTLLFAIFLMITITPLNTSVCDNKQHEDVKFITYYDMVQTRKEYIRSQDFSYDLFVDYMRLSSIRNRDIVISQAILETSWFQSNIFKENNNLFGMKRPRVRETTVVGVNRGHAVYDHWTHSVDDYKLWYDFMTRNREYDNYYLFLIAMGYAEDRYYIPKLRIIHNILLNDTLQLAYVN